MKNIKKEFEEAKYNYAIVVATQAKIDTNTVYHKQSIINEEKNGGE